MKELTINPKFKDLLPPLSEAEITQLEESIIENGCEQAIQVWQGQIIDGHNRYGICSKHDIEFDIQDRSGDFETEEDVLEWIYVNQLGRRNLNPNQKLLYIGELYAIRKKKHGDITRVNPNVFPSRQSDDLGADEAETVPVSEPEIVYDEYSQIAPDDDYGIDPGGEPAHEDGLSYELDEQYQPRSPRPKAPRRTASKIAKEFDVSPRTVERAEKIAEAMKALPEEDKRTFMAGKMTQTAVLEKAREISDPSVTPAEDDDTRDEFTALAAKLSKKLHENFTEIKNEITKAKVDFYGHGQAFDDWASHLSSLNLDIPMIDVKRLRSLRICHYCEGEKCELCQNTGYLAGAHYAAAQR